MSRGKRETHRHSMTASTAAAKPACPITPVRHATIIADLQGGDWPAMVALRNGIAPNTLLQWVLKGLDPTAPEEYRDFADEFVRVEAELSHALVQVIMNRALGRRQPPIPHTDDCADPREKSKCTCGAAQSSPPNVEDAKWMLTRRFQFLWHFDREGRIGGQSAAEVVCQKIEAIESEQKAEVRRILQMLPADAKGQARKAGFLVP